MPRRSLMLAGGGLKIAFQAGVLQVLLDEAGLQFDHADAVSAACFNLAMYAQGLSGTAIADAWRQLDPVSVVNMQFTLGPKLLEQPGLLNLDKFRTSVFPAWGLDFATIRNRKTEATFNIYNFSKHELRSIPAAEMTEDYLIACASLAVWFPPVQISNETWIDAIFHLPCNFEEAIQRGADELWVIWTTSQAGEWFDGLVNNFFGLFEATTNYAYKQMLRRVERSNAELARGKPSEYGRHILVRELKAEVPVHYLLNFSRDRAGEAVNRGVEYARRWCQDNGLATSATVLSTKPGASPGFHFSESASGRLANGSKITLRLNVEIDDLDRFLTDPDHLARLTGEVECEELGGKLPVIEGTYNLFTDVGRLNHKSATYRLQFREGYALAGTKHLDDDPGADSLADPATIHIEITKHGASYGHGTLRSGVVDFLHHLSSFRSDEPGASGKLAAIRRFGAFYLGRLWDVYARDKLPIAPF